jgi:hypothetical protein
MTFPAPIGKTPAGQLRASTAKNLGAAWSCPTGQNKGRPFKAKRVITPIVIGVRRRYLSW